MDDFALVAEYRALGCGEPDKRTLQEWDEEFREFCVECDSLAVPEAAEAASEAENDRGTAPWGTDGRPCLRCLGYDNPHTCGKQPKKLEVGGDIKTDEYGRYTDINIRGVIQRMRWIAPGEFMMGSPESEAEREDDEIRYKVTLSQGYWLADTACTQALWQAVMGENPSEFQSKDKPVETVSWEDVQRFIERLNAGVPGQAFRLPTEAEWEYACRAGSTGPFWFGDQITPEQVNYDGEYPYAGGKKGVYREESVAVKALPCNRWGLYQMHGNVWEWCQDWYGDYGSAAVVDPAGPDDGDQRVLRGGGWFGGGASARSARRLADDPDGRFYYDGFRLARGV